MKYDRMEVQSLALCVQNVVSDSQDTGRQRAIDPPATINNLRRMNLLWAIDEESAEQGETGGQS